MTAIKYIYDFVWDEYVEACSRGNILQTSKWGILKSRHGWDYEIVIVKDGNSDIRAGALVLYKKVPFGIGTIAYIPRGPVLEDWSNESLLNNLMTEIKLHAKKKGSLAIWVEPELFDLAKNKDILYKLGYRLLSRTIQPPRTILMDLSQDEQFILSRMKPKTRYNIRLAKKKGIIVKQTEDVDVFYKIMIETGNRDNFEVHSIEYYRDCVNLFSQSKSKVINTSSRHNAKSVMFVAEYNSRPLAALILLTVGNVAWYFYGASSNEHRDKMPAYALQWEAFLWAKAQGCTVYDFWGVPDENYNILEKEFENRDDGLWGVYRFKRGFGGEVVRYIGLWELPLNPIYKPLLKLWDRLSI